MGLHGSSLAALVLLGIGILNPLTALAQGEPPVAHDHTAMPASSWHLMQDGVVFVTVNHQGGPRGGSEIGSQNWWMGMAQRPVWRGTMTANVMLSLDPLTLGGDGYREIFQVGESLNGIALIDRQHPHEFLMRADVAWQAPLPHGYRLTLEGGPVGSPALGPVPFMHRASAAANPTAPLAHHNLDSSHIAMGTITGAIDRGPWQVESSVFRAREPDDDRWDLMDPGPLDSWSVRGWYRPRPSWTFQISHGFLDDPEELEAGDVRRTTASASWMRGRSNGSDAVTIAYGRNNKEGADFSAVLAESMHVFGRYTAYGRYEAVQVETDLLRFGVHAFLGGKKAHVPDDAGRVDAVNALTLGGTREIGRWSGWDLVAGGDVTAYVVPQVLQPTHGNRPVSFHLFVRLRPPSSMRAMMMR